MASYKIIDEPKVKPWDYLIVNPLIILFVGVFLPFLWDPPLFGRFWMPVVWLMVNTWLLGSSGWLKELAYAVVGLALCAAMPYLSAYVSVFFNISPAMLGPYMVILIYAVFFLTLYLIVFRQSVPYELYCYIKESGRR